MCSASRRFISMNQQPHATRFTLMLRASFSTCARSYSICMPSHTSGLDPNALERRTAISAEIPPLPFTKLCSAWRVTPRRFAVSVTVNPNGSIHSWRTMRPGWGGFFLHDSISFSDNQANPRRALRRVPSARIPLALPFSYAVKDPTLGALNHAANLTPVDDNRQLSRINDVHRRPLISLGTRMFAQLRKSANVTETPRTSR